MKLESMGLRNFKAFQDAQMRDIPSFCVVVGANGSGKSTLFDVFGFLKDAMTDNVQVALDKRGGFKEVRTRGETGPIEIELKYRFTTQTQKTPLVTYSLHIDEVGGKAVVAKEELKYPRGVKGRPWRYLNFVDGAGEAVTNDFDDVDDESKLKREKQTLSQPHDLSD